ncbi:hypothetical protein FJ364_00930 [Candidatus Dependentiae bacterium]|nr:hypothetical protein [Candidatus Dependentiae bacterium]
MKNFFKMTLATVVGIFSIAENLSAAYTLRNYAITFVNQCSYQVKIKECGGRPQLDHSIAWSSWTTVKATINAGATQAVTLQHPNYYGGVESGQNSERRYAAFNTSNGGDTTTLVVWKRTFDSGGANYCSITGSTVYIKNNNGVPYLSNTQ